MLLEEKHSYAHEIALKHLYTVFARSRCHKDSHIVALSNPTHHCTGQLFQHFAIACTEPEASDNLRVQSRRLRSVRRVDRKSTRLNSSHVSISYAVFCLNKKKQS